MSDGACCHIAPRLVAFPLYPWKVVRVLLTATEANIYGEIGNDQAGTKALHVFKSPTTL